MKQFAADLIRDLVEFFEDIIKSHFDKLMLTFVFLVMMSGVYVGLYMVRNNPQLLASVINWLREETNTILGTLLGLCTGYAVGKAVGMAAASTQPPDKPGAVQ